MHLLGKSFAHALVKTVKLWERPTPYELIKQLEVVRENLPEIYDSGTTLSFCGQNSGLPVLPSDPQRTEQVPGRSVKATQRARRGIRPPLS